MLVKKEKVVDDSTARPKAKRGVRAANSLTYIRLSVGTMEGKSCI